MRTVGVWAAVFLLAGAGARAQQIDEAPLPTVQVMSCAFQCLNFTPAKPIDHDPGRYPSGELNNGAYSEAYVWLRYTVGVDGKTHDITPIYTLGKKKFTDLAIDTVKEWTFKPALANGKPVPESRMYAASYGLKIPKLKNGFADINQQVDALITAGKPDEARALAETNLAKPELSFVERGTFAGQLAKMAMQRKDYLEARRLAVMGTMANSLYLPMRVKLGLWQARLDADLQLGEYADAFMSYNGLIGSASFKGDTPYAQPMRELPAKLAAATHLIAQGKLPTQEEGGGVYWHVLYRRTFGFTNVTGSLEKYFLSCNGSTTEGAVSLQAQWHVPASWEGCMLYVHGAPGTRFSIVETNDDQSQKNEVMAHYDEAVRADPKSTVALMARGRANRAAGNDDAAMADFSRAIALDPKLTAAYIDRGILNISSGKHAQGLADMEAALKLDHNNSQAKSFQAFAHLALGDYPKALDDYDAMIAAKNNTGYDGRTVVYFAQGKYPEAEQALREILKTQRGDLGASLWLYVVRVKQSLPEDPFFAALRPFLRKTSWQMEVAELYHGRQSLEQTEANIKAAPKDPDQVDNRSCAAKFFLGEYRLAHGDAAGARADFTAMTAGNCYGVETVAAAAELKRLAAN